MLKICVDSSIEHLHNILETYFEVEYLNSKNISKESLKNADALIIRSTKKYGAEILTDTPVKFVGTVTSGYDHIDIDFCEKNNIFWSTAHGSNAESVAQYIKAALIEIIKKKVFPNKLTLGIVGVGAVGTYVQKYATALGFSTLLKDPFKNFNDNIFEADIITLHTPLEKNGKYPTLHLANETFFKNMKQGAWFINAARGGVCDYKALINSIQNKHVGGAIIDVWENEPNIDVSLLPFIEIATPHIAGHSTSAKINAANMMITSLNNFFKLNIPVIENKLIYRKDYSIREDDFIFRRNPEKFTEIRNTYER